MPRRFPLYAKILCWFFLNLVLLAVVFYLLFRAQFHFGMDWLLSDRIQTAGEIISEEMGGEPPAQWDATLKRFAVGYHDKVRFLAFGGDGTLLAGDAMTVPPEVREQLGRRRAPPPGRADENPGPLPEPPPLMPPGPPRRFIHTADPSLYWVIQRRMIKGPEQTRPGPLLLVAVSDSFAGGGLFFELTPWLGMGAGAVLFSVLLWFPLVRDLNRSIAQLTTAANQIAEGRFDVRVDQRRRDELGALGQAINQMASRLNDLVAGQKRFLGDVAHELCSPLAKLRVSLGILDQQAAEDQKPYVTGAEEEAAHMAGLVNELLSFSKASLTSSITQLRPVPVRETAEKAVRREAAPPLRVALEIPADLQVMAEPELLARALANLLRNAVRYAGEAGPVTLSARRGDGGVLITVADSGPGVPVGELARIFDPFYRVDASRDRATGGAGLGLAIVKTCIESCGGTVTGRNREPSGLEVTIRLPEAAPS
jgi:two-component system, OmpR family, sensor histidine kinase CpxA